jgi:hypothetical protein
VLLYLQDKKEGKMAVIIKDIKGATYAALTYLAVFAILGYALFDKVSG